MVAGQQTGDPVAERNLYARDRFKPDCIRIVLDGVSTGGHTAAMLEPYADVATADPSRARGMLMSPAAELQRAVVDRGAGFRLGRGSLGEILDRHRDPRDAPAAGSHVR